MNSNDEQPQPQGNKNTNPPRPLNLQSHSFSSLPDEIAENVLARISRCNYPSLSLVSKRFHSLLFSPTVQDTISHQNHRTMWCLTHANAFLLDEKIYVMGRWGSDESQHNWMEMLDIKTQKWRHLRIHGVDEFDSQWFVTNVFEEKMYAIVEKKSYAYDTQENMELLRMHRTCGLAWRPMLRILNLGGKLLVMWIPESKRNKREPEGRIWCAKIALEKRESEVWGKIEWANSVYDSYWFSSCVVSI
ncbi:hypothetical protein F2Q70_00033237 [Brassica cretica]|uniref:F-box domain-containing protein n=1 Tax=Brassica cretica TaxID=69181 RepID=A0A8S9FF06_BRACR|nr:hypothetical protein F2Q70_00033237 [Brassica cretica]